MNEELNENDAAFIKLVNDIVTSAPVVPKDVLLSLTCAPAIPSLPEGLVINKNLKKRIKGYGWTVPEFLQYMESFKYACEICEMPFKFGKGRIDNFYFDHGHIHYDARGIICNSCNGRVAHHESHPDLPKKDPFVMAYILKYEQKRLAGEAKYVLESFRDCPNGTVNTKKAIANRKAIIEGLTIERDNLLATLNVANETSASKDLIIVAQDRVVVEKDAIITTLKMYLTQALDHIESGQIIANCGRTFLNQ